MQQALTWAKWTRHCRWGPTLASFPVSTPSFFSHVVKKIQHAEKKLGVETGNEASPTPLTAPSRTYSAMKKAALVPHKRIYYSVHGAFCIGAKYVLVHSARKAGEWSLGTRLVYSCVQIVSW